MANTQKYLNHLLQNIGITPACSEEERLAAEEISRIFSRHGFEPEVQEFTSTSSPKLVRAILCLLLFISTVLMGVGGFLGVLGTLVTILCAALYLLERFGRITFPQLGSGGLSQNVIAYHKAAGPLASPRNRPVVVVAHYDSPRADFLAQPPFSAYRSLLVKLLPFAVLVPVIVVVLRLFPLPDAAKIVLWVLAILVALIPLLNAVAILCNRYVLPYTSGSVCNKSSLAALLGIMDSVSPYRGSREFPDDVPFSEYMAEQQRMYAELMPEGAEHPMPEVVDEEERNAPAFEEEAAYAADELAPAADAPVAADEQGEVAAFAGETVQMPALDVEEPAEDAGATTVFEVIDGEPAVQSEPAIQEEPVSEAPAPVEGEAEEEQTDELPVNSAGCLRYGVDVIRSLGMVAESCAIEYEQGALPMPKPKAVLNFRRAPEPAPQQVEQLPAEKPETEARTVDQVPHIVPEVEPAPMEQPSDRIDASATVSMPQQPTSDEPQYAQYDEPVDVPVVNEVSEPAPAEPEAYPVMDDPFAYNGYTGEEDEPVEETQAYAFATEYEEMPEEGFEDAGDDEDDFEEIDPELLDEYQIDELDEPVMASYEVEDENGDFVLAADEDEYADDGYEQDAFDKKADSEAAYDEDEAAEYEQLDVVEEVEEDSDDVEDEGAFDEDDALEYEEPLEVAEDDATECVESEESVEEDIEADELPYDESIDIEDSQEIESDDEELEDPGATTVFEAQPLADTMIIDDAVSEGADDVEPVALDEDDAEGDIASEADEPIVAEDESEDAEEGAFDAFVSDDPDEITDFSEFDFEGDLGVMEAIYEEVDEDEPEQDVIESVTDAQEDESTDDSDAFEVEAQPVNLDETISFDMGAVEPLDQTAEFNSDAVDPLDQTAAYDPDTKAPADDFSSDSLALFQSVLEKTAEDSDDVMFDMPEVAAVDSAAAVDPVMEAEDQPLPAERELKVPEVTPVAEAGEPEKPLTGATQLFDMSSVVPAAPQAAPAKPAETVDSLMAEIEHHPARRQRSINVPDIANPAPSAPAAPTRRTTTNRSALLDLPDPSAGGSDPFAAVGTTGASRSGMGSTAQFTVVSSNDRPASSAPASGTFDTISAPAPDAHKKKRRGLFSRKKRREENLNDWLDNDDGWKGGATGNELLTEDDLREAVASLGDDELLGHDIWFVATGASEHGNAGIREFLESHRDKLRGVFLINLECIGAGRLAMLSTEGERRVLKGDKRIMRLVSRVSADFHHEIGAVDMPYVDTDAHAAMERSLRSLTIAGVDGASFACSHSQEDIPLNIDTSNIALAADVVTEVIRRS